MTTEIYLIFPDWDPPPVEVHMDPIPRTGEHLTYEEGIYEVVQVLHRIGREKKIALDLKYLGPTAAGMGLLDTQSDP